MTDFISLLLLCGLFSQVLAGVPCKQTCHGMVPKIAGEDISRLALTTGSQEVNCAEQPDIECSDGQSCLYEKLELRAKVTDGSPDQQGVKVTVGCQDEANVNAVGCALYDDIYPMTIGSVNIVKVACDVYKGDEIPNSALGKEAGLMCNECADLTKVDANGGEEIVGTATCETAKEVECSPKVTKCARITLTFTNGAGANFRKNQIACHKEGLTCESLKAEITAKDSAAVITDCALGDTKDPPKVEKTKDEGYQVEEKKSTDAEGSSVIAKLSAVLFFITLSHLW